MGALRTLLALLVLVGGIVCLGESPPGLTPAQYGAELDHLLMATGEAEQSPGKISALIKELPGAWRVQAGQQTLEISTEWLRHDLHTLQETPSADLRKGIREHLQQMRSDLDSYLQAPPDVSQRRAMLSNILARPEFHSVRGPSWVERLKQKVYQFLFDLLRRVVRSSAIPTVAKTIVYSLMGMAVLVVAFLIYRSIRRGTELESILPEALPVSAKEWTVWMAEAREAAGRGNWRDAVHLAYWAGISFLEAQGMWRPDRARTPREYLRLLPAGSGQRPTLQGLTQSFELVWYGGQPADAGAFSETLEQLEKLGCR